MPINSDAMIFFLLHDHFDLGTLGKHLKEDKTSLFYDRSMDLLTLAFFRALNF